MDLNKCAATNALAPPARRLHLAILAGFTATGHPPTRASLASIEGVDVDTALAELVERDVVALDQRGELRAAYPFSPTPTPHLVTWDCGPTVHAMCAIDALGMSTMLDRPVTITSTEPDTGHPITIDVDRATARWNPDTAVVFAATTDDDTCCPSVDRICGHINFFTTPDAAHTWATRHPHLTGTLLDQHQALTNGIAEFGTMMQPA